LAVVRTGSVTGAADELIVTQPSVSAAVTALAREVGTTLLERDGRGVRPTPAGAAFAPFAADVIGLLEKGRRAAQEAAAHGARVLRIAAVTTAAESFVPGLMREFSTLHDDVSLTLSVANRVRVLDMVLEHEADVAFGGRPPRDDRIEAHAFAPNAMVLITAPGDPLADGSPVAPSALADCRWLLRETGSGTRVANEQFLLTSGLDVPTLTVGSNGAIKQAARAGLGVSFVSRDAVAAELDAGLLAAIPVDPGPPPRQWHVMRSRVGPPRAVLEDFVAFVRETAAARAAGRSG
ncbi:MAG: transcriptional regulator, LysR family, partial [Solirubrobacterales bacterium]|nr:transcriptional regulator, LysR family [Solirubrobacterales bacterium]